MQAAFSKGHYAAGAIGAVQAATQHLVRHFPADGRMGNELPDKPLVL
jgi:uncharacterized membrane protein